MTGIEQAHAQLVEALRSYRDVLTTETEAVDLVLGTLDGGPPPKPKTAATPRKKPGQKPKAKASAKATAPKRYTKLKAPTHLHDPVKRIGKLSSKCLVRAIDDDAERRKFVADLVEKGFTRTKPMQRMAPGLFDVCMRDGATTVTWWPKEAAA